MKRDRGRERARVTSKRSTLSGIADRTEGVFKMTAGSRDCTQFLRGFLWFCSRHTDGRTEQNSEGPSRYLPRRLALIQTLLQYHEGLRKIKKFLKNIGQPVVAMLLSDRKFYLYFM